MQTCCQTWCYVDVFAYNASLEVLESGKEPNNERSVALLNFEDLSYKIELRTDDTMTQDATARTVKILDSSSEMHCLVRNSTL